jgi:PTH1 family peptidyl-tRNA hydrolase
LKSIFGLGNPGRQYAHTRHNVGQAVIEELAKRYKVSFKRSFRLLASLGKTRLGTQEVLFIKPHTFMNNSGICVRRVLRHHKLSPEDALIVYDDVDLPLGRLRLRPKGSSGGHRGMESIMQELDTEDISRLRIGIGPKVADSDLSEYVLSDFTAGEKDLIGETILMAASTCIDWVNQDITCEKAESERLGGRQ